MNYYNEFDPKAAAWLSELIKNNLIPAGHVDTRSIANVTSADLKGYAQCHFFAGVAGWSLALSMAGWPEDRPVWTGSCPCQPFSEAGEGKGEADARHLWPALFNLIRQCRPAEIFGEQVASKAALGWFDGVSADLESAHYAAGAFDLCSAGVSAPNIRQRLYFAARDDGLSASRLAAAQLALPDGGQSSYRDLQRGGQHGQQPQDGGAGVALGDTKLEGLEGHARNGNNRHESGRLDAPASGSIATAGGANFWSDFELIYCRDGKVRRIESGLEPLVAGQPGRVALLRGFGNAINVEIAAEFVRSYLDIHPAH